MSLQYSYLNVPPTYNDLPVKQIGSLALSDKYLRTVILPENIEMIQAQVFESIDLPDTLEKIDTGAFTNAALDEIVIPLSVTTMSSYVFDHIHYDIFNIKCEAESKPDGWYKDWNPMSYEVA